MKDLNVSFSWSILNMERKASNGYVYRVKYALIGDYKGEKEGEWWVLELDPPAENLFVPYENLTESLVIDWVKTQLGAKGVEEKEKSVRDKVYSNVYPESLNGLPWKE